MPIYKYTDMQIGVMAVRAKFLLFFILNEQDDNINAMKRKENSQPSQLPISTHKRVSFLIKQNEFHPQNAFRSLQQTILNLFHLAKQELSQIYQGVVAEIRKVDFLFFNKTELSVEQFQEAITEIKEQAETKMSKLTDVLPDLLVTKTSFEKISSQNSSTPQKSGNSSFNKPLRIESNISARKVTSITSLDELETIERVDEVKKIILNHPKIIPDNRFLLGQWNKLEQISIQNKGLTQLESFKRIKAEKLQILNLSNNKIQSLKCFCGAYYPNLTEFSVGGNEIESIHDLPQAQFHSIEILNLSNNFINDLSPLIQSYFPVLLELNLSHNLISNLQPLIQSQLPRLQILNLDNNKLTNLQGLPKCTFPSLKILSFSGNMVHSLRFVSQMNTPKLQGLLGYKNRIKSIQPLVEAYFPQLKEIVLHDNAISDISSIKQMNFPNLIGFDLEKNEMRKQEVGCFVTESSECRKGKKKFPFLQL